MTVVRPAPQLRPVETGPGFRRVAAWLAHRAHGVESSLTQQRASLKRDLEYARRQVDELRAAGARVGPADPLDELVRRVAQRLRGDLRQAGMWSDVDEVVVVAVMLDHTRVQDATERARRSLETAVRQARHVTDGVKRMADELGKVQLSRVEVSQ